MRVLDELREGLREKVRAKWEKSERKCSLEEVEELVLKVSFGVDALLLHDWILVRPGNQRDIQI